MRNFFMKIAQFMSGRYARFDCVNMTCLLVYLVINIVTSFIVKTSAAYWILLAIGFAAIIYMFFRFFSKSIWKREKEKRSLSRFYTAILDIFRLTGRRIKYYKTSIFRRCPYCKAVLKLPHKKGKHSVRCPKCSEKFDIRIIF